MVIARRVRRIVAAQTQNRASAPLLILIIVSTATAQYAGGTGTADDPYLIYTAKQLQAIGTTPGDLDKHFKLMANIDLSDLGDERFNIIGADPNAPFRGTFDGNGCAIANFVCTSGSADDNVGLFGIVADPNAVIRNLRLIAPRVDRWVVRVGTLVGHLREGTLLNCHAQDVEVEAHWYAGGGLVGESGPVPPYPRGTQATVRNCSCTGRVSANFNGEAGGLVGRVLSGSFYDCFVACEVSSTYETGGLTAYAAATQFVNCYAAGTVTGDTFAGGLIGRSLTGELVNCYSASRVSGTRSVGGLIGSDDRTIITASFWDAQINDRLDDAGSTGRTTRQMQDPNTFIAAGWDFIGEADGPSDLWAQPAGGGYPVLWWQLSDFPAPPFSAGKGDRDDPYLIETARQLNSIGHNPRFMSAHFRLVNDVDLSGVYFYPIGSSQYPYGGVFDGAGFTISNLTHTAAESEHAGLFRVISGSEAEVRDLRLIDPCVETVNTDYVGSLAGLLKQGTLRNCHVAGGRISGQYDVGGLVGQNGQRDPEERHLRTGLVGCSAAASVTGWWGVGGLTGVNGRRGFIADCHASGDVAGSFQVGGLVGASLSAVIADCSSAGQVAGERWVGGLLGLNWDAIVKHSLSSARVQGTVDIIGGLVGGNGGTVMSCYSRGEVTGGKTVGGLAGSNGLTFPTIDVPGTISGCYAAAGVAGSQDVGGLVGSHVLGEMTACFWDVNASGLRAKLGGAAQSTAQMQMASTFLDAGWDFVGETANGTEDIWWILEGQDYPRLWWEAPELMMDD